MNDENGGGGGCILHAIDSLSHKFVTIPEGLRM